MKRIKLKEINVTENLSKFEQVDNGKNVINFE